MHADSPRPPRWTARHFAASSTVATPAEAWLEGDHLVLSGAAGGARRFPLGAIVVVRGHGRGEPVQLELRGEAVEALIVEDRAFLDALRAAGGGKRLPRLAAGPPLMRLLLASALFALLALVAAWRWGVPALAGFAADRVPPAVEREFGAMVVADMAPPDARETDERIVDPARQAFDRLVEHAASPRDSFQLVVVRAKLVNAFAAPGGYVVITTGLLGALRGPEELAAVLAHEISHVTRRHTTRGLFARLGIRVLFALIAGDQPGLGQLAAAAGTLGELSYSRADETDADRGAIELLARSGVDPRAMGRALESIGASSGRSRAIELDFLSTHPSTEGRRERVAALAARTPLRGDAKPLVDAAVWEVMKGVLASRSPQGN